MSLNKIDFNDNFFVFIFLCVNVYSMIMFFVEISCINLVLIIHIGRYIDKNLL